MNAFQRTTATVACSAALAASVISPSLAHECFNASRSARANAAIAQHSHGWFDIQTSQFVAIGALFCLQDPAGDCPPPPPLAAGDIAALQDGNLDELIGQILGFVPAGSAVTALLAFGTQIQNEAACLGVPTHFLTVANGTAGGGASEKAVTDGKGIDHFPETYGEQLNAAYATVLSGGPSACD